MVRHWKAISIFIFTIAILVGCSSSNSKSESSEGSKKAAYDSVSKSAESMDASSNEPKEDAKSDKKLPSRMVIYNANVDLEVKKIEKVEDQINTILSQMGGYIVQQNMNKGIEERQDSSLTVRVPQENFQAFLVKVKKLAIRTNNQSISGQDVTEEYVDLKSRLDSKKVAEKRLIQFMNEAKDTKTLLEISNELSKVQEEAETIEGQIKYIENQTNLSTVTITLFEDKVVVPGLENDELNTWEKTKKQFMKSINFIVSFFSGLFIFIIGNIPIIVILGLIGVLATIIYKRIKKSSNNTIEK